MTAGAELRVQLQVARDKWKSVGGTVWGHLISDTRDSSAERWVMLMAELGVEVIQFEEGDRVLEAGLPLERAMWVYRGAPNGGPCLVVADPWDVAATGANVGQETPRLATGTADSFARWKAALQQPEIASEAPAPLQISTAMPAGDAVQVVSGALLAAANCRASDIHFECDRTGLRVKLRVDGVLRPHTQVDSVILAQQVISRIKVLAQLDITEQRVPQDGRFRHLLSEDQSVDLRVSVMPSVHGEDAVLRLLDRAQLRGHERTGSLQALEFDSISIDRIRSLTQLPHGMLLVTGPTGSGKTTTVYAALSELNSGEEKIITIEDPVEYELKGVLQIPVNERKGLTFARGLRSVLRHDPDRILVGEIRDAETAEIAVQSALTGHQVFTTVHANSLFEVMGRFRHFGLDMFGFTAALNGVVVQRLVRSLCDLCGGQRAASDLEHRWLVSRGLGHCLKVPTAVGCGACGHTGYRQRFVLAEVHQIEDGFRDLVTAGASISAMRSHVQKSGVMDLQSVAATAVANRRTTLEEIRRVVGIT